MGLDDGVYFSMPAAIDLVTRRKELEQVSLRHLTLVGPVHRRGAHLYIHARCSVCGVKREYLDNNLLRGKTRDCRCQRRVKYGQNPLARIFGQRYDAIRYRYGKKAGLPSREDFVRHMSALAATAKPKIRIAKELRKFRIQRVDDRRGFKKENLRLVRAP
jgi:hypothetical protein